MKRLQIGILLLIVLACQEEHVAMPEIDNELQVILDSLPTGEFIVVSGKVISVSDALESPAIISEHDPQPRLALVNVCRVLLGQVTSNTIKIAFPTSADVAWWKQSRSFEQGLKGTWILSVNAPSWFSSFYPSASSENGVYAIANSETNFYEKAFCAAQ